MQLENTSRSDSMLDMNVRTDYQRLQRLSAASGTDAEVQQRSSNPSSPRAISTVAS